MNEPNLCTAVQGSRPKSRMEKRFAEMGEHNFAQPCPFFYVHSELSPTSFCFAYRLSNKNWEWKSNSGRKIMILFFYVIIKTGVKSRFPLLRVPKYAESTQKLVKLDSANWTIIGNPWLTTHLSSQSDRVPRLIVPKKWQAFFVLFFTTLGNPEFEFASGLLQLDQNYGSFRR